MKHILELHNGRPVKNFDATPQSFGLDENKTFCAEHAQELEALFADYPQVCSYNRFGQKVGEIAVWFKEGTAPDIMSPGCIFFTGSGKIAGWRSYRHPSLILKKVDHDFVLDAKKARLAAMLDDHVGARKYCDMIASQIITEDQDDQAFNVPVALDISTERFNAEYYSEEWLEAWRSCLKDEFNARSVTGGKDGIFVIIPL